MLSVTTRQCFSSAIPCDSPTSIMPSSAIRAPACAAPTTTGISGRCLPEALHQVTIDMSDRGIPKIFRHMHGFGPYLHQRLYQMSRSAPRGTVG